MTHKDGSASVSEFMGKPVSPAIPYDFEYSVFDNLAEARQSEDWPSDSEVLKWVNQTAERSSKAKAYQEAVKTLRESYEKTREFKVANLAKSAITAGICATAEEAAIWAEAQVPA